MRPFNGIGDWLFCLAVLKFVNRQRPDVACYVDYRSVIEYRVGRRFMLPPIVPELYADSDVIYSVGSGPDGSMATRDDLIYRKWPPNLYIESVVHHLNDQTDLGIRYEPGVYPVFRSAQASQGDYVVMVGHGKSRLRAGKEWGLRNFTELAERLAGAGIRVVQIGGAHDSPVTGERYLGASASTVLRLLSGARAFVGIENGMMVLAGYLRMPQVTIYDGASHPTRVNFDRQLKLTQRIEPAEAADRIQRFLQDVDADGTLSARERLQIA